MLTGPAIGPWVNEAGSLEDRAAATGSAFEGERDSLASAAMICFGFGLQYNMFDARGSPVVHFDDPQHARARGCGHNVS